MSNIRLSGLQRLELAALIKADINKACVALYDEGKERNHLGSSIIGEKCNRRLWYGFRWMHREQFDGRMLRLFNRGHKEEDRFIEWLRAMAATVLSHTEDGKQFRITGVDGHYGGSLDSVTQLPERYQLPIHFLTEYKTHNDKSFKKLVKLGVKEAKPKHFVQMCCYGDFYKLDYALYFAINKNDDDIYVEVVALDHAVGKSSVSKAQTIITATTAPNKIAASAAYTDCAYCPMKGICHNGEKVDVNCRSCASSSVLPDGKWLCNLWGAVIPEDAFLKACPQWTEFPHR